MMVKEVVLLWTLARLAASVQILVSVSEKLLKQFKDKCRVSQTLHTKLSDFEKEKKKNHMMRA